MLQIKIGTWIYKDLWLSQKNKIKEAAGKKRNRAHLCQL